MRFLRGIALTLFLLLFCAVLFGCKGKATDNEISMRVSDNYIQWRIGESGDWNNLISLEELQGSDGLGIDSISINAESELVIKFTDGTERNLGNIKGSAGTDGVGLQSVSINENGELIITLSNNQQVNAGKVVGTDGKDGREVELRVDEARNYIQWRYKDEETWYDLISLEALTGEQGNAGLNGLSAYEIYKQYYPDYEKTEEEWIDDLVNGRLATVEKVKLTFELNGGQGISEMEVVKGRTVDLPLPSRCGYRFLGWYSGDGVFDGKFTHFLPVVKDLTLYAKWELIILEGIEIADGDLELPQDSVHQLTVVEKPSNALLPDLVWSSSAPEVVSVDENGLLTPYGLGQADITVKSADGAFSDSIVVTVIDDVDPEFKGVEPEPGLIIVRDGDKFKLKIRASDKNLYELEIDHNINDLPEFSVYASEDLPYGSLEAKASFEAYGVTVDYDAESQTWEIDFGENVTRTFVSAKKVKFYIVLRDKSGNQWGTMYGTTPENTFEYEFISYADYALQALLVAETYEEMREALLTYQDVLSVPADAWKAFHQLPENGVRQQAAIGVLLAAVAQGKVAGLDAVSYYFQLGLREELCKHDFVEGINAVENETEMIEAFLMMIPEFDEIHNLLVAEDIIPGLDKTNYTTAIKDLNAFITAGDTDKISKVAAKLLEERGRQPGGEFADEIVLTDVLRGIIDFDLDDPEFKGVEPAPGTIVIKDEGFKWIVKAYDEHLYELEIDHSLEATLPEFSVYANAENPYGTDEDREKFEQYGVIVTYDEETQTWTIDFGMAVTRKFIQAGTVTFYIVLKDVNGYAWGSMFDVTPENTFIYKFEDYYVNALAAILAAESAEELAQKIIEYKDACQLDETMVSYYNILPAEKKLAVDSILWAHKISGFYLQTLADVKYYFEHYVSIAAAGLDPAEVNYTVEHYLENADDEDYKLADTETKTALTGSLVTEQAKVYEGFTPKVAEIEATVSPDGSLVIKFYYNRNTYTITVHGNGANEDDVIITAKFGALVSAPVFTRDGYEFAGWDVEFPATMPLGGLEITAQWKIRNYSITYFVKDAFELGFENPNPETYTHGSVINLLPVTVLDSEGVFIGWFADPDMTEPIETIGPSTSGDLTVYGFVRYNDEVSVERERQRLLAEYDDLLKVETLDVEGYYLTTIQWQSNSTAYSVDQFGNVTITVPLQDQEITLVATITSGDVVDYAIFVFVLPAETNLKVTFMVDGEVYEEFTLPYGSMLEKPENDPEKEGFVFLHWATEPDGVFDYFGDVNYIYDDLILYAVWEEVNKTLTVEEFLALPEGAEVTVKGYVYKYDDGSYIISENGVAVLAYKFKAANHGDLIVISGEKDYFNGCPQFANGATLVETISSGNELPLEAIPMTIEEIVTSDYPEDNLFGKYLQVEGRVVKINNYYWLEDESGNRLSLYQSNTGVLADLLGHNVTIMVFFYGNSKPDGSGDFRAVFAGNEGEFKVNLTPEKKIEEAKAEIELTDGQSITGNLVLPTVGKWGVTISWISDNPDVINPETGEVTRPEAGEEDVTVTLTATFSVDDVEETVMYVVIVKARKEVGEEPVTVIASYSGPTTNMTDGNNAATIGLDENVFTVLSYKGGYTGHIGLNKDGQIRLYGKKENGNGTTLQITIAEGYRITGVEIVFGKSTNGATARVTLGEAVYDLLSVDVLNQTQTYSDLDITTFSIQNTHQTSGNVGQVFILSIIITYVPIN